MGTHKGCPYEGWRRRAGRWHALGAFDGFFPAGWSGGEWAPTRGAPTRGGDGGRGAGTHLGRLMGFSCGLVRGRMGTHKGCPYEGWRRRAGRWHALGVFDGFFPAGWSGGEWAPARGAPTRGGDGGRGAGTHLGRLMGFFLRVGQGENGHPQGVPLRGVAREGGRGAGTHLGRLMGFSCGLVRGRMGTHKGCPYEGWRRRAGGALARTWGV